MLKHKKIIFAAIFVILFIIFLLSPIFNVKDVVITGNQTLTNDYIEKIAGLSDPINIFLYSTSKGEKNINKEPYAENVDIKKDFLHKTVYINITEHQVFGYIEFMPDDYLYVDEDGLVLEEETYIKDQHPVIVGLNLVNNYFQLGQVVEVDDPEALQDMVTLSHLFEKYDMGTEVIKVDLSDTNNIKLYIGQVEVDFGSIDGADQKIRTVKYIMEDEGLADLGVKGVLDVSSNNGQSTFRISV